MQRKLDEYQKLMERVAISVKEVDSNVKKVKSEMYDYKQSKLIEDMLVKITPNAIPRKKENHTKETEIVVTADSVEDQLFKID